MQLLRVACVLSAVQAFVAPRAHKPRLHAIDATHLARRWRRSPRGGHGSRRGAEGAAAKIDSFVKDNKARAGVRRPPPETPSTRPAQVMLFMKGEDLPQCGFSNMAVQILNAIGAGLRERSTTSSSAGRLHPCGRLLRLCDPGRRGRRLGRLGHRARACTQAGGVARSVRAALTSLGPRLSSCS